jgi:hypothetical protein
MRFPTVRIRYRRFPTFVCLRLRIGEVPRFEPQPGNLGNLGNLPQPIQTGGDHA